MQIPNLNGLRAFEVAARHLNFRLAAEELCVTQGAVAQQIRRLEQELGQSLFHREARGVTLTEAGRRLQPNTHQAMQLLHQGLQQLQDAATVTLSVPPSFATKWLLPRLPKLAEALPHLTLNLRAEEHLADLHTATADLAVRLGPKPSANEGLATLCLAPLRLVAVTKAGLFPQASNLSDFTTLPLIQDGHRDWQKLMSTAHLTPQGPMLQFNQTALALDAARQGQGVALVPDLYLQPTDPESPADSTLEVLWRPSRTEQTTTSSDTSEYGFYLLWSPARQRAEITALRNWLRDQNTSF